MEIPNDTATWVDTHMAALIASADASPDANRALTRLRQRRHFLHRRRRNTAFMAAGVLAAAGTVVSYPRTRAYAQECVDACVSETSRVGRFMLAKLTPGNRLQSTHHAERREAPDFKLTDANGHAMQLSSLRGKVVLLNFWATWCPPCRAEIPWFIDMQQRYKDQGFAVVGVSLDDGWGAVRPFLANAGINYPVVVGNDKLTEAYGGLETLPATLILDRQGRVVSTHLGLVSRQTYETGIQAALNE